MNDIGRFHAANMGLLKTIFEMNLQLFKENQELSHTKTLLLFIIRDYIGTPLDKLKSTLLSDLDRLWAGITKPDQYRESRVRTMRGKEREKGDEREHGRKPSIVGPREDTQEEGRRALRKEWRRGEGVRGERGRHER